MAAKTVRWLRDERLDAAATLYLMMAAMPAMIMRMTVMMTNRLDSLVTKQADSQSAQPRFSPER